MLIPRPYNNQVIYEKNRVGGLVTLTSLNNKYVSIFITWTFRICFFINFVNTHDDHLQEYKPDFTVYILFSSLQ